MPAKYETAILQDMLEFTKFVELLRGEGVRSYLEIGSKHGGSLWHVAKALPKGSRIVAVDQPHGDGSFKESEGPLRDCTSKLRELGYDVHLFLGDSIDPEIIESVRKLGPYDCVFIDANHTEPYVRRDWASYGQMARIVAFHDIGWIARPEPSKKMPIEVPIVWNEIKNFYRHQEIKLCPSGRDNGIGVLWRT